MATGFRLFDHAHGTAGARVANRLSDVAVAAGLAVWDFKQRVPARELELGSTKIEREGELAALTREILVEFAQIGREGLLGLMQLNPTGIHFLHAGFEFESHQTLCGSGKKQWADRRRRAEAGQSFHDEWEDSTILE